MLFSICLALLSRDLIVQLGFVNALCTPYYQNHLFLYKLWINKLYITNTPRSQKAPF